MMRTKPKEFAMLRAATVIMAVITVECLVFAEPVRVSNLQRIRDFESRRLDRIHSLDADSAHSYDMLELSLDYRVEDAPVPATGIASLTIVGLEDQSIISFNAEQLDVISVLENGSSLTFLEQNDTVYVQRFLAAGDTVTLDFSVSAPVISNNGDVGYHAAWQHAFTFSEPYGARRWYPCFDQPFDKFNRISLAVNMPDYWSLAANGLLVETTFPEAGRKREVYVHNSPISPYLVMICAGQFAKRYESVDGVLYRYFTFSDDSIDAVYDWGRTPQMVAVFNDWFGEYPFEEYGMVQAALFNGWGAMEHQTFTTYGFNLVDSLRTFEGIVAHELAHQWFGDALSPVDFRNMWLNEGFATYGTALWNEVADGQEAYRTTMAGVAEYYFNEDSSFRYAVYDPPADYLFGAAIYFKGAFILHMLREQLLGDSLFRAALNSYRNAHLYSTVDTEDFIASVNGVADQDVHWFFDQWVYQAGHPVLDISITAGSPTAYDITVTIAQQQSNAPIFRFPISVDVQTQEGTFTRQFWFEEQIQTLTQSFGSPVVSAVQSAYQPLLFQQIAAGVPSYPPATILQFKLEPPYPNPFNAVARIPFELSHAALVTLKLYDLTGRSVSTIAHAGFGPGSHEVIFDPGPALATGLYFVALEAAGQRQFRKIALLK